MFDRFFDGLDDIRLSVVVKNIGIHILTVFLSIFYFSVFHNFFRILMKGSYPDFYIYLLYAFLGIIFLLVWCTECVDVLLRILYGIRPVRTRKEKEKLLPIFFEIKDTIGQKYPKIKKIRRIYIKDTMEINAMALGYNTAVVTRGAVELLSKEKLAGAIAHEMCHHINGDPFYDIVLQIARLPLTIMLGFFKYLGDMFGLFAKNPICGILSDLFFFIYVTYMMLEKMILTPCSRYLEYKADEMAYFLGYGKELTACLYELDALFFKRPKTVIDLLLITHPPKTKRIARLEQYNDDERTVMK